MSQNTAGRWVDFVACGVLDMASDRTELPLLTVLAVVRWNIFATIFGIDSVVLFAVYHNDISSLISVLLETAIFIRRAWKIAFRTDWKVMGYRHIVKMWFSWIGKRNWMSLANCLVEIRQNSFRFTGSRMRQRDWKHIFLQNTPENACCTLFHFAGVFYRGSGRIPPAFWLQTHHESRRAFDGAVRYSSRIALL